MTIPPTLEINIADLQIASGLLLTFHAPKLPVPPANVSPAPVGSVSAITG